MGGDHGPFDGCFRRGPQWQGAISGRRFRPLFIQRLGAGERKALPMLGPQGGGDLLVTQTTLIQESPGFSGRVCRKGQEHVLSLDELRTTVLSLELELTNDSARGLWWKQQRRVSARGKKPIEHCAAGGRFVPPPVV